MTNGEPQGMNPSEMRNSDIVEILEEARSYNDLLNLILHRGIVHYVKTFQDAINAGETLDNITRPLRERGLELESAARIAIENAEISQEESDWFEIPRRYLTGQDLSKIEISDEWKIKMRSYLDKVRNVKSELESKGFTNEEIT